MSMERTIAPLKARAPRSWAMLAILSEGTSCWDVPLSFASLQECRSTASRSERWNATATVDAEVIARVPRRLLRLVPDSVGVRHRRGRIVHEPAPEARR